MSDEGAFMLAILLIICAMAIGIGLGFSWGSETVAHHVCEAAGYTTGDWTGELVCATESVLKSPVLGK